MKNIYSLIFAVLLCSCATSDIGRALVDSDDGIMIVAHRACWKKAPENSIKSIKDCIDMGIDMIEIDVRRTKDDMLVLMHDKTVDRTTQGKGQVRDFSLAELEKLFLKNGAGGEQEPLTNMKIPTLREALLTARGKVLINLDAKSEVRDQAFAIVEELGMQQQVIIKMVAAPEDETLKAMRFIGQTHYMPVIWEGDVPLSRLVQQYRSYNPIAYEVVFQDDDYLKEGVLAVQHEKKRLWVNTMYPNLCADRDEKNNRPDNSWGHFIDLGVDMIQTDQPEQLINYLYSKGLR